MTRRAENGFTLVELLVVVAIIIALLAILVPSLNKAIGQAERAACASNLDQIGTALSAYLFDSRGRYPDKVDGTMYSWVGQKGSIGGYVALTADRRVLNAYMGEFLPDDNVDIARCPSDGGAEFGGGTNMAYNLQGASYGSNTHSSIPSLVQPDRSGINMTQVRSPSRMVAMGEDPAFAAAWWTAAQWASSGHAGMFWHGDEFRWNLLFADGHVAYVYVPNPELVGPDYTFHRDR